VQLDRQFILPRSCTSWQDESWLHPDLLAAESQPDLRILDESATLGSKLGLIPETTPKNASCTCNLARIDLQLFRELGVRTGR